MALITPDQRGHPCPGSFFHRVIFISFPWKFREGWEGSNLGGLELFIHVQKEKNSFKVPLKVEVPLKDLLMILKSFSSFNSHPWNCPRVAWVEFGIVKSVSVVGKGWKDFKN